MNNVYQFSFKTIDGQPMRLSDYKGKVLVLVNTASQCGFTGQYEDLQKIYEDYKDQGLVVIGMPCNQFGNQEPDPEDSIAKFVEKNYGVTFPLTSKIEVKGNDQHPFFKWVLAQQDSKLIKSKPRWNFHKFIINRNGEYSSSFGSTISPSSDKMRKEIEKLLAEKYT